MIYCFQAMEVLSGHCGKEGELLRVGVAAACLCYHINKQGNRALNLMKPWFIWLRGRDPKAGLRLMLLLDVCPLQHVEFVTYVFCPRVITADGMLWFGLKHKAEQEDQEKGENHS